MQNQDSPNSNIYPGYKSYAFGKNPHKVSVEVSPLPKPNNLWEAAQIFLESLGSESSARAIRGTILKYLAPALGGKLCTAKRMNEKDQKQAIKFLKKCPIENMEQIRIENFDHLSRSQKSHIKSFADWVIENDWIHPPEQMIIAFSFKAAEKKRKDLRELEPTGVRQGKSEMIALGAFEEDFIQIGAEKILANSFLEAQVGKLKIWLETGVLGLASATIESYIGNILRFLGWLHRYKSIPLNELNLYQIAPYVSLKIGPSAFALSEEEEYKRKIFREAKAADDLKKKAKAQVEVFNEYIDHTNMRPGSAVKIYNCFLCTAYWAYQGDTENQRKRDGWKDIPLVNIFREARLIYAREEEKEKKSSRVGLIHRKNGFQTDNNGAYLCDWIEILEACDRHRIEALQELRFNVRSTRIRADGRPSVYRLRRKDNARFQNWLRFIQLALIVSTPPGRAKDYYSLQFGNNLLKGDFINGKFLNYTEMDSPENASWWIYLSAESYKTGRTYGTFLNRIPNIKFPDLRGFYEYLDEYIFEWLPKFSPEKFLFVNKNGEVFDSGLFGSKLQNSLNRYGFAPMSPKNARKAFITYIEGLSKADIDRLNIGEIFEPIDDSYRKAIALAMKHSVGTQQAIYNQQSIIKKIEPATKLCGAIAEDYFLNIAAKRHLSKD